MWAEMGLWDGLGAACRQWGVHRAGDAGQGLLNLISCTHSPSCHFGRSDLAASTGCCAVCARREWLLMGKGWGSQTCSMVLLSISAEWGPLSAQCIHPPNPTLQLCPGLGGGDREDSRGSGELCCSWGRLGAVTKVTELSTWLRSPR